MGRIIGVTPGQASSALFSFAVPQARARARRWADDLNTGENTAAYAARMAFGSGKTITGARNTYARQIGTTVRDIPLAPGTYLNGLGDFDWSGVVKGFVGEIGKGVGMRIGGQTGPSTVVMPPPKPAVPGWVVPAVAGVGVLGLGYLLVRKKR